MISLWGLTMERYTIRDFNRDFPDDDACLEHLTRLTYPDGIVCRKCEQVRPQHRLSKRKAYSCDHCGTHVYPLAGTIFEKSPTPLKSWFYGMYLVASTRCGISAKQLERELGVTYKTAWRIFHQIRKLMAEDIEQMFESVEADDTCVGGARREARAAGQGLAQDTGVRHRRARRQSGRICHAGHDAGHRGADHRGVGAARVAHLHRRVQGL